MVITYQLQIYIFKLIFYDTKLVVGTKGLNKNKSASLEVFQQGNF
jgi:hypothetical protein